MSNFEDIDRGIEHYETGSIAVFDQFYDAPAEEVQSKDAHVLADHARQLVEAGTPTARFRELSWDSVTLWQVGEAWHYVWGDEVKQVCSNACIAREEIAA